MTAAAVPEGLLPVWKPPGPTSGEIVYSLRRVLQASKIGHAGALDPFAEGILLILVGRGTRLFDWIRTHWTKTYRATLRLGVETDTLDPRGKPVARSPVPEIPPARCRKTLASFQGRILQRPPLYSALRKNGRRLYAYARAGERPEIPARPVHVHRLELIDCRPPDLEFLAEVSSGVYLRSLGRDIAAALGTCGHLAALVRERIGPIGREQAMEWIPARGAGPAGKPQ